MGSWSCSFGPEVVQNTIKKYKVEESSSLHDGWETKRYEERRTKNTIYLSKPLP